MSVYLSSQFFDWTDFPDMSIFTEPELNLDEQQCAIRDAAMIVARLSLIPTDGYMGSWNLLSRVQSPNLATRSVRSENITISGINFALFHRIRHRCR